MLDQITPVILTYNEEPNIERTLAALSWAKRVVVLDSFSDDKTQAICLQYDNVDFHQRKFDTHAQQWNAALALNIQTNWVLALDADYVLSPEIINEIKDLEPDAQIFGYQTSFIYKIDGKPLRGTLYPPVTTLYRRHGAEYQQDGHTQRIHVAGKVSSLQQKIYHDDRKSPERWHRSQRNYARQEAEKLTQTAFSQLGLNDKIRYFGLAPLVVIPYTLFARGVILDGWPGLKYTWQRLLAELYLVKARLKLI